MSFWKQNSFFKCLYYQQLKKSGYCFKRNSFSFHQSKSSFYYPWLKNLPSKSRCVAFYSLKTCRMNLFEIFLRSFKNFCFTSGYFSLPSIWIFFCQIFIFFLFFEDFGKNVNSGFWLTKICSTLRFNNSNKNTFLLSVSFPASPC